MTASTNTPGDPGSASGTGPAGRPLPLVCPICDARYPADFKVCPRDAARLEDVEGEEDDPLIGTIVGDTLRLVRSIGEGGTARVYEARHTRLDSKRFAVKVLHTRYASNPTVLARFQREAESAGAIGHPAILDVIDIHRTPDGRPYLVTELLEGSDFGSLLKEKGKLEIGLAVRIARQVCRALAAAHGRGVVHRDMKPENIFLVGYPESVEVKVLDFGISKLETEGAAQLTRTGMVVGTPAYMSPEQASGAKVDARTDIYAVGAILYRALTGRRPFEAGDATEVLSAVLSSEPARPRSIAPGIPDALELVIQRAMAKNVQDRYASMDELDAALAPFDTLAPAERMATDQRAMMPSVTAELAMEQAARDARWARPTLLVGSLSGYLWAGACLVDALASVLSLSDAPDAPASSRRVTGLAIGILVVSIGPLVLWLRHLSRIWRNTHHAVELATAVRRIVLAAIVTYAVAALLFRLLSAALSMPKLAAGGPLAGILLALLSYIAGGIVFGVLRARRRAGAG